MQKDVPQSTSSSTAAQVTSGSSSSFMSGDLQIPTGSAEVAADIAKYTNKVISQFYFIQIELLLGSLCFYGMKVVKAMD